MQGKEKGKSPIPTKNPDEFPMRINKYLALKGFSTRRGGDELVERGIVYINGTKAVLGSKVLESDQVEVKQKGKPKQYRYFAYNKPLGVVTHSPEKGQRDIQAEIKGIPELKGVFPIGRLDRDTHGLIILTDDGRVTDRLLNPDAEHDKEYEVRTQEKLRDSFKETMEAGVDIDGYITKDCKVKMYGDSMFRITLREGKKHQIRRMVSALHATITDLKRVRVMNIELGNMREGEFRPIEGEELGEFLELLGLSK